MALYQPRQLSYQQGLAIGTLQGCSWGGRGKGEGKKWCLGPNIIHVSRHPILRLTSGIQNTDLAAFELTGAGHPRPFFTGPWFPARAFASPCPPAVGRLSGGGPLPDLLFIENCRQLCMHDA